MARAKTDAALKQLRDFGLTYPGSHLKSPWPGHKDLAVNDKTFAYLSVEGDPFSISCKLPHSSDVALMLPFATPTGYGLGKSGWVTAKLDEGQMPDIDMFKAWIDESYRAQAPKRLIASMDNSTPPAAAKKTPASPGRPPAKTNARPAAPIRARSAKKLSKAPAKKKAK
jgi:predicted DNA-binding protein (MmcQ/YjbR family)